MNLQLKSPNENTVCLVRLKWIDENIVDQTMSVFMNMREFLRDTKQSLCDVGKKSHL